VYNVRRLFVVLEVLSWTDLLRWRRSLMWWCQNSATPRESWSRSFFLISRQCKLSLLASISTSSDPLIHELALQVDLSSGFLHFESSHQEIFSQARAQLAGIPTACKLYTACRSLAFKWNKALSTEVEYPHSTVQIWTECYLGSWITVVELASTRISSRPAVIRTHQIPCRHH